MPSFAIIIPCYNEEKRLNKTAFSQFLQSHADVKLFFVNDGSKDLTIKTIEDIIAGTGTKELINLTKNAGKGEAVRQGIILALIENSFDYIGFLDADLSTSLEEYYELYTYACKNNADFLFGSRIKKLGSVIKRSFLRHVIGRIIISVLDKKFQLGYYDTQCGAKLFRSKILELVIRQPFSTKWFFDIELFLRLKTKNKNYMGIEYPLKSWNNVKGSKINLLSFPSVCKDIFVLLSKY